MGSKLQRPESRFSHIYFFINNSLPSSLQRQTLDLPQVVQTGESFWRVVVCWAQVSILVQVEPEQWVVSFSLVTSAGDEASKHFVGVLGVGSTSGFHLLVKEARSSPELNIF